MPEAAVHHTRHSIDVEASADAVYPIIADVTRWPYTFGPTIHVDLLEHHADGPERTERLRLWATANGVVRSWTSRRTLTPAAGRIVFRQEVSAAPVASMGGEWRLEPLGDGRTRVILLHDFTVAGEDPGAAAWVEKAVDANSTVELAALRAAALPAAAGTRLSFEDSVHVPAPPGDVYEFLYRADRWNERLPHVARVELTEDDPDVQTLEMDTIAPDGSVHTTKSVRVGFPTSRIVYKQTTLPPLLAAHTGAWTLRADGDGVTVTSQHTVVLRPERIEPLLGAAATLADARALVQRNLSTNSTRTLQQARQYLQPVSD
ncbi:aromatase/cyclase [Actinoplanes derwentensis]|uniref:Aromatase n=1 Tax=Actinoplanes derwentensis TaxID=113562 RepID=A0A1H2D8K2_9ACTN|nr:aromatase/cyclase [Actinoplanes derwentensis]GID89707.1 actinorhodin polyketide synthase bifunctional cyclase/dehydratase [Actinoplanes derwentensis]SDT78887.1 aromatase [Actinoplanes derwentensis]